jgi:hypothetical protein
MTAVGLRIWVNFIMSDADGFEFGELAKIGLSIIMICRDDYGYYLYYS